MTQEIIKIKFWDLPDTHNQERLLRADAERLLRAAALAAEEAPHLEDPLYVPSPYVLHELVWAGEAMKKPSDD